MEDDNHETIINWLYEEIKRKDKIIEELENENRIILDQAIRRELRSSELKDRINRHEKLS